MAICVPDKRSVMAKQILSVIFSRNGVQKTLVSYNTPEFYDERQLMSKENTMYTLQDTFISPPIEQDSRKNGTNYKNWHKGMFATKGKSRNLPTEIFKLLHYSTC